VLESQFALIRVDLASGEKNRGLSPFNPNLSRRVLFLTRIKIFITQEERPVPGEQLSRLRLRRAVFLVFPRATIPLKHLLSTLLLALLLVPPLTDAAANEAAWRARIAQALHLPPSLPALEVEMHGRFEPEPEVVAERISYSTTHGMRVPAILYLPLRRSGRMPGIIIVNGHGGDKFSWYAYYTGILYARAGAAVLTYDPLGEGERNPQKKSGTRAHDAIEQILEFGPRMGGPFFADLRRRTIALRGNADSVFDYAFEKGASHRPYFLTRPVALWLERTLDFPNWTEAGIRAMPVTRIGDWGRERGVELDRGYAIEMRESGTPALGEDVPAPTREQLCVYQPAEWNEKKPLLTIDHWVRHVRQQLGLPPAAPEPTITNARQ
jgi:hypothetical protein